jgi:uncharacterized protein YbjT (DUF2867 family)
MESPIVLVVGAAGRISHMVVPELLRRGAVVRALVRSHAQAEFARKLGAQEVVLGDLRDRENLAAAAKGAQGVFHVGPAFVPDEAQLGLNMVEAARDAGVTRFVFSSVNHPTNTHLKNHVVKQPVEDALYASGLQYTVLQPHTFLQNIAPGWSKVVETGIFAEAFSKTARVARVDYRDVAEVAAIALTGDSLAYGTFELCTDGLPNREDIAAVMSDVLGRKIEAREVAFDEWAAKANLPYDDAQKALLAKVYAYYSAYGNAGNSLVLRSILGRPPRTLRRFIEELAGGTKSAP